MHPWEFPRALHRPTQGLFHQQCWCWGADIRHAEGNLLLAHGFTRARYSGPGAGSSRYERTVGIGATIFLWGFGAAYGVVGTSAVFIDRYDPTPMLVSSAEACRGWHQRHDVRGSRRPACWADANRQRLLFVALCRWISGYERWVARVAGIAHRAAVLAEWKDVVTPATAVARHWRLLAWQADRDMRRQLWPAQAPTSGELESPLHFGFDHQAG